MAPNTDNIIELEDEFKNLPALFSKEHLEYLNETLAKLPPKKILEWAIITLPNLYQTTAFGLTGN